jgi:cardiolipin synthase
MFKRELIEELKDRGYSPRAWPAYVHGHLRLVREVIEARPAPVRSVIAHGAAQFTLLLVFALALALLGEAMLGRQIFVSGAIALVLFTAWALLHLGLLVDLDGRPLLAFGAPNALTLFRAMAGPPLVAVAAAHGLGLALVIYAAASLSDVADGFVARRRGPVSKLGVVMDALVDIVWNSSAVLALFLAGILPWWILLAVGVRYGLLLVGSAGLYLVNSAMHIRPTRFGKLTGFFTSGVILLIIGNRLLAAGGILRDDRSAGVESLLEIVLGFILAATIVHVFVLGALNFRASAGRRDRVVGRVVGRIR